LKSAVKTRVPQFVTSLEHETVSFQDDHSAPG